MIKTIQIDNITEYPYSHIAKIINEYKDDVLEEANKSKSKKKKVGCLTINEYNVVIGKGHNRVPEAIGYIDRTCEDSFGETLPYVLHAEVNAISNAKRRSEGVIYNMLCTHNPCMNCVAHILEYERIRNFIFITRNYNPKYEAALQLLLRVNCNVYSFEDFSDKLTKYELVKG